NQWTNPAGAYSNDGDRSSEQTNYDDQDWYNFNFNIPAGVSIEGIEVSIEGSSSQFGQYVGCNVRLSWNGGTAYSSSRSPQSWSSTSDYYRTVGSSTDTWGKPTEWSVSDFSNSNFRVRLEKTGSSFTTLRVDHIRIRVYYSILIDTPLIDLDGTDQIAIDPDTSEIKPISFPGTTEIFINGISGTSITIGQWYHVAITDTTGVSASALDIARNSSLYYDGAIDEFRISKIARSEDWIATEYNNQKDPNNFYSVGAERTSVTDVEVNALDLYGNPIPDVNISIYDNSNLIRSDIADSNGIVIFNDLVSIEDKFNFTVFLTSNIEPYHTIIINRTVEAILIEGTFQTINLICNISRNIFNVVDIEGIPLDSGWVIVGNDSDSIQNCTIDSTGHATFRWLNITPYQYNYTVWYRDSNYNPIAGIEVASGDIFTPNSDLNVTTLLTTVNFTVLTYDSPFTPIDGAKLILNKLSSGESIVNLTTDYYGNATLRWVNSSVINSNYSLQVSFYGQVWDYEIPELMTGRVSMANFTVKAQASYTIKIHFAPAELENLETKITSLNPTSNIIAKWGTKIKIRALLNVTNVPSGLEELIGPTYADSMSYQIFLGTTLIQSKIMPTEDDYIGRHQAYIETYGLEIDTPYLIKINAQKSGYVLPSEIIMTLFLSKNDLILNQSQNDDSPQYLYWQESRNMSAKPYGEISEEITLLHKVYNNINPATFKFSVPDISSDWNLSQIIFNLYNISWNALPDNINITIAASEYGIFKVFNSSNHNGHDYALGTWTGIVIDLDESSSIGDNIFEFTIGGTFGNTINIIADASFIRDKLNIKYNRFNITNAISLLTAKEGWAIKNITFELYNCYNTSSWSKIDPLSDVNMNISTNEGIKYSLDSGSPGSGSLTIDNRIIYPLNDQFLFTVENYPEVIFDVKIKVEYIQEFYQNDLLEIYNLSKTEYNFTNGGTFQFSLNEHEWNEDQSALLITGITDGIDFFLPSQLNMTITINGTPYAITDLIAGQGMVSIEDLIKDNIYTAVIDTIQPTLFNLTFVTAYSRLIFYETRGTVSYSVIENPTINGEAQYFEDLGCYMQVINSTQLHADEYTVRFSVTKENYVYTIKDLELIVLNRPTLLNSSTEFFRSFEQIYAMESINFTFLYVDNLTYQPITNLDQQTYVWEYYDEEGQVIETGRGNLFTEGDFYVLDLNTEKLKLGEYLVVVTLSKENHDYKNAIITLVVLERPTLINGSYDLGVIQKNIYIGEEVNFLFSYIDTVSNVNITNLSTQSYIWKEFNEIGQEIDNGTGLLVLNADNFYVLDFDTETRNPSTYELTVMLDKENYTSKSATVLLTINRRSFAYSLSANFKNNQINVVKGKKVAIVIYVVDLTRNNMNLTGAIIQLTIGNNIYTFEEIGAGLYQYELSTKNVDAFFTSKTLTGSILITKQGFNSEELSITIVVEMEELFPGVPLFYVILAVSIVAPLVGSIVGYRLYKNAKIPTFVKRVRSMKKAIEGNKSISESLLYRAKEVFIGERVKDMWDRIDISIENTFGIRLEKKIIKAEKKISEAVKRREIRPIGLVLMKWNVRVGTEILAKYPEETEISERTLMQLYSAHEYSGEKGVITLTAGLLNILSYYTGPDTGYYLILILNSEDDPDVYEGGMPDVSRILIENIEDDSYLYMFPSLFQRLSLYPSLSDEEILALNYLDEIKRMIINSLREIGLITKSELTIWLKDKYHEGFVDLEATFLELMKKDIIKQVSVKGLESELIMLTNDFFMLRVPPDKLLKNPVNRGLPTQFAEEYLADVKKFFQTYRPTGEDNLNIINILTTPEAYEVLRLLRTAIVTMQDLEKLKTKGVEDVYGVLKLFWDNQMIKIFRDEKNNEYYALLSDFYMDLLFPKYILKVIKSAYEQKSISTKALIEYLRVLEDTYYNLKYKEKTTKPKEIK
ncbi:MAG: hypothetical protein ACFFG0_21130, partial [Candidatus Thorarchaeota archaeon]